MKRNKYDSFVIWLVNQNKEHLIPENIRKEIPYSTISTWRSINYSQYIGHEVSKLQKEAIDQLEIYQRYKNLKKVINTITRVWIQTATTLLPLLEKSKQTQQTMLEAIEQLFTVMPKKNVLKLFSISTTTFYKKIAKEKIRCGISPLSLCFKRHPLQLAKKEVETIHHLFKNPNFDCWPASSIYHYALRNNLLFISLSTFYKYTHILGLKRKWRKSEDEKNHPLKTSKPNEFIHIDTTFWGLPNGVKAAIILVCDNFSKMIIGWNIRLKKDGENAKKAIQHALKTIQKYHPYLEKTSLITDGGGENHNFLVEDFIRNKSQPEIIKLLALKDVKFSNSAVEAINKIIKRYLRKKRPNTLEDLVLSMHEIINDYNTVRPHGSLLGLTPLECYTKKNINLDFNTQKLQAKKDRIAQNSTVNCTLKTCKK